MDNQLPYQREILYSCALIISGFLAGVSAREITPQWIAFILPVGVVVSYFSLRPLPPHQRQYQPAAIFIGSLANVATIILAFYLTTVSGKSDGFNVFVGMGLIFALMGGAYRAKYHIEPDTRQSGFAQSVDNPTMNRWRALMTTPSAIEQFSDDIILNFAKKLAWEAFQSYVISPDKEHEAEAVRGVYQCLLEGYALWVAEVLLEGETPRASYIESIAQAEWVWASYAKISFKDQPAERKKLIRSIAQEASHKKILKTNLGSLNFVERLSAPDISTNWINTGYNLGLFQTQYSTAESKQQLSDIKKQLNKVARDMAKMKKESAAENLDFIKKINKYKAPVMLAGLPGMQLLLKRSRMNFADYQLVFIAAESKEKTALKAIQKAGYQIVETKRGHGYKIYKEDRPGLFAALWICPRNKDTGRYKIVDDPQAKEYILTGLDKPFPVSYRGLVINVVPPSFYIQSTLAKRVAKPKSADPLFDIDIEKLRDTYYPKASFETDPLFAHLKYKDDE